jgi:hypothetical protein
MRTDRKSRRFKDANGKFVFIRKPKSADVAAMKKMDAVTRVHVRSYRHNEKMPEGFSMGVACDIKD